MKTSLAGRTFLIMIIASLLLSAGAGSVLAQGTTIVRVDPASAGIQPAESLTVNLQVLGGEQVNAYDVTITYDPSVIELKSWAQGGYLSNTAQVYKAAEPGRLQLVFTQLATPAVSGDGVLLNLVFAGVAVGTSPITIERLDLADSQGNLTNPQLESGSLTVLATPTRTPPSTLSPTSTLPANTSTFTPPVPTPPGPSRVTILPSRTPTRSASAVQSVQTTKIVASQPIIGTTEPTEAGSSSNIYLPAMQSAEDEAVAPQDRPDYSLTNRILWLVLIVLAVLFLFLVVLVFRRKRPSITK